MSTHNLPDTGEATPPASPSASKSSSRLDYPPVVRDGSEEQKYLDLVDGVEEQSTASWVKSLLGKRGASRDLDAISTRRSVFDDPHLAPFYWPKKNYENIHRFDPLARWTYREEKALLRKIDRKIMIIASMSLSMIDMGRGYVTQASTGSLSGLHLTTDDFNSGNIIFYLSFLCAELLSQLVSKRVGPDRWIPTQMCLWSIVSFSQFWLTGRATFFACRALLGLFQGGLIPNLILYMSYFYTKTEFPSRFAGICLSMSLSAVVASFLAYGNLHLDGVAGKAGWRWSFLIQGLTTLVVGVVSFFKMSPSPTQTKTRFRPNGWFTEREEIIIVNKILRDDPTKGDMHNREGLTLKRLWTAICDYDLWPVYILAFVFGIPSTPPLTYLSHLLQNSGFNPFDSNLLILPYQMIGIMNMILITFVSELVNERTTLAMLGNLWVLPFLVALYALQPSPKPWLFFGLLTTLLSYPYVNPIQVGWCSRNSGSVASRTVSASLYNMFYLAGNLVAAQIYTANDAPRYERGYRILIIICSVNVLLLYPGTKMYYIWRNRRRANIWNSMTAEEKAHYLNTTKDVGNRRLDFRFVH